MVANNYRTPGPIVLCKTRSVLKLLCVLEQLRVDNSRAGLNWLEAGPDNGHGRDSSLPVFF